MPHIYRHDCKTCGRYYESPARFYCSLTCTNSDPERLKRLSKAQKRRWANGNITVEHIQKFIKAGSDATRGKPNPHNHPPPVHRNEAHPFWKGDAVSYSGVHHWVKRHFGKPSRCEHCNGSKVAKRFEWANVSGQYSRDRSDWLELCSVCHKQYDRRVAA